MSGLGAQTLINQERSFYLSSIPNEVTHSTITADLLLANAAYISTLYSDNIEVSTLKASTLSLTTSDVSGMFVSSLRGNTAFFSSMTLASDLSGGVGFVRFSVDASGIQVDGDPIRFDNLVYLTSTINIVNVSTIVDTDIFAKNGYFSTLSTGILGSGVANISTLSVGDLSGNDGSFNSLSVSSLAVNHISSLESGSNWSLWPTLNSSITFQPAYVLSNVSQKLYFAGQELTDASGGGIDWSYFDAQTDVSMNNFSLRGLSTLEYQDGGKLYSQTGNNLFYNGLPVQVGNASNVSQWANYPAVNTIQTGGFPISSVGNITVTANSNIRLLADSVSTVADQGLFAPAAYSDINLTAQNGLKGRINLTANPGAAGIFGEVNITANGGTTGGVGTGGLVNITANTPLGFSNATSAIKINAAGVNSYAGAIPSIGSVAGYNFVYGNLGVNLCAGIPPSGFQVPGTTYLYGTNGVTTSSDFYVPNIYPYYNGLTTPPDLNITGRVTNLQQVYVNLSNVKNVYMGGAAAIQNARYVSTVSTVGQNANFNTGTFGTLAAGALGASAGLFTTLQAGSISTGSVTAPLLSTVNVNLSTINGLPFTEVVTPQNIVCSSMNVSSSVTVGQSTTTNVLVVTNRATANNILWNLGLGVSTISADSFGQRVWVSDSIIGTTNLGPVDARIINFSSIQSGTMSTIDLVCSTINGAPPGGGGGGSTVSSFQTLTTSSIFTSSINQIGGGSIKIAGTLEFATPNSILNVLNVNDNQATNLNLNGNVVVLGGFNNIAGSLSTTSLQTSSFKASTILTNDISANYIYTSSIFASSINQIGGGSIKIAGTLAFATPNSILNVVNVNDDQANNLNLNGNVVVLGGNNNIAGSLSTVRLQGSNVKVSTLEGVAGVVDVSGGMFVSDTIELPLATGGINFDDGSGINYSRLMRRDVANNNMLAVVDTPGLSSNNMMPLGVGELWLTGGADQYAACRLYSVFPYGNYELDAIDEDGVTLFAYIQGYYNGLGVNPGYVQAYSNVSSISGYNEQSAADPYLNVIGSISTGNLNVSTINGAPVDENTFDNQFSTLYVSSLNVSTMFSYGSNTAFNYPIYIDYDQAGNTTTAGVAIAVQGHNYAGGAVVNRIEMGARATGENYIMSVWPGQNLEELFIDATDLTIRDGIFSTIINLDPWGLQTTGGILGPFVSTLALNVSSINNNDANPAYTNNIQESTMTLYTASTTLCYWDTTSVRSNVNTSGYDTVVGVNGTYKLGCSLQAINTGGTDDMSFFFLKNGTAIPNSATYSVIKNNELITTYAEIIEPLNNGDTIQVGMYTTGAGVQVSTVIGTPAGEAPAGIFTVYKID